MKLLIALGSLIGLMAFADVLLPSETVITGKGANDVYSKIIQVTGKDPELVRGRFVVNADSQITCFKAENSADSICNINVKK